MLQLLLTLSLLATPADTEQLLTLEQAQQLARENNIDIKVAKERLLKASYLSKKAWGFLLPAISANYSFTRNNQRIRIPFGLPSELEPIFQTFGIAFPPPQIVTIQKLKQRNASVNASWMLLNGRTIPVIQNAYDMVDLYHLNYAQAELALQFGTALAYYNALSNDQQLTVQERALAATREHLALAQAREEIGEATRLITLRSEVEVATSEQNVIQAEIAARLARQALATLLGQLRPDGTAPSWKLRHPELETDIATGDDLILRAQRDRLDLEGRKLELTIAERSKLESWMKLLPQVIGTGSYRWSDAAGFSGEKTNWQVGLALQWSIFEGGLTFWEIQERQHDINAAALLLEKTRSDIAQQVREARLNLESAEAIRKAANRRLQLAQQSAELVQAQFELGGATQLDVIDANRAVADAGTASALAQLGIDLSRLSLEQVLVIPPVDGNASSGTALAGETSSPSPAPQAVESGIP